MLANECVFSGVLQTHSLARRVDLFVDWTFLYDHHSPLTDRNVHRTHMLYRGRPNLSVTSWWTGPLCTRNRLLIAVETFGN